MEKEVDVLTDYERLTVHTTTFASFVAATTGASVRDAINHVVEICKAAEQTLLNSRVAKIDADWYGQTARLLDCYEFGAPAPNARDEDED